MSTTRNHELANTIEFGGIYNNNKSAFQHFLSSQKKERMAQLNSAKTNELVAFSTFLVEINSDLP
jgi:hypothetical protein